MVENRWHFAESDLFHLFHFHSKHCFPFWLNNVYTPPLSLYVWYVEWGIHSIPHLWRSEVNWCNWFCLYVPLCKFQELSSCQEVCTSKHLYPSTELSCRDVACFLEHNYPDWGEIASQCSFNIFLVTDIFSCIYWCFVLLWLTVCSSH